MTGGREGGRKEEITYTYIVLLLFNAVVGEYKGWVEYDNTRAVLCSIA